MFNQVSPQVLILCSITGILSLVYIVLSVVSIVFLMRDRRRHNSYYRWLDDQMADKRPGDDPRKPDKNESPSFKRATRIMFGNPKSDPEVDKVFRHIEEALDKSQDGFDTMDGAFEKMDAAFGAIQEVLSRRDLK